MVKSTSSLSLEPIDRLAEKVQTLVGVLERTRAELTHASEDNARLSQEVDVKIKARRHTACRPNVTRFACVSPRCWNSSTV